MKILKTFSLSRTGKLYEAGKQANRADFTDNEFNTAVKAGYLNPLTDKPQPRKRASKAKE